MKKSTQKAYFALLLALLLVVLSGCAQKEQKPDIPVRFAAQSEGQELLLSNEGYLEGLNQNDLNTMYSSEEAENFWDVFGRNTDYVIDPEETLADNFSFAILNRDEERLLQTPELVENIRAYLRNS